MKSVSDRLGYVLSPIVVCQPRNIHGVGGEYSKEVFYQQQIEKVQSGVTNLQNQQSALFSFKPLLPSQQTNPQEKQLLEERMKIERYFSDFGSGTREYVVDRIRGP